MTNNNAENNSWPVKIQEGLYKISVNKALTGLLLLLAVEHPGKKTENVVLGYHVTWPLMQRHERNFYL